MPGHIAAAGAVLWRRGKNTVETAIVHRPRYGDWSLPKGKLDPGESVHAAAVREVAEETGFAAVLGRSLGQVHYVVGESAKTVSYFAARAAGGSFEPNDEVDVLRWIPVSDAVHLVTYPHDRVVLARFAALPAETTTLLVVRHAHAGKKDRWHGPDAERPLSPTGLREREALTRLLPLFGPSRVLAAPKVRCVDTVRPLAGLLGVSVEQEPALAEQAAEGAAVDVFRRVVATGEVAVVCSQGGVIPGALAEVSAGSGVELGEPQSRKGSVWVLSFAGEELVAADYVDSP
ncbi:NUDIX hydrolase [Actinokineospora iranica]|uniref:8-oxo-dGTP diphosphatase n=1 Tax=Actinokineospora iranica TaxID=1271860 RepID=A0A1G6N5I4_9PSEU|nr:NUDIX hydrolase [Actinokineospora iranica]SDC63109.1 8-oxo-dGTP diphosphatase [Actinokineospora iranica]